MPDRGVNGSERSTALLWWAYGLPACMFAIAILPKFNVLYSGHGGPAWFAALLSFPVMAILLLTWVFKAPASDRRLRWHIVGKSFVAFLVLAFPASMAGAASIRASYGLSMEPWALWVLLATPFGWFLFS